MRLTPTPPNTSRQIPPWSLRPPIRPASQPLHLRPRDGPDGAGKRVPLETERGKLKQAGRAFTFSIMGPDTAILVDTDIHIEGEKLGTDNLLPDNP